MTMAMSARPRVRANFPRQLLQEQVTFALLVWAGLLVAGTVVLFIVASFTDITVSVWDSARQAAQWFAFFIGVYVGWQRMPLHITHGRTRREFMAQLLTFLPLYAAALSAMVVVTFLGEAALYGLTGWDQEIADFRLFDSPFQVHLIFLESWLLLALWASGGALVGSAWYRSSGLGGLAAGLAIVLAGASGIATSGDWGPFGFVYERISGMDTVEPVHMVLIHLGCIALAVGLTWLVVRDVPIRSREA